MSTIFENQIPILSKINFQKNPYINIFVCFCGKSNRSVVLSVAKMLLSSWLADKRSEVQGASKST